MSVSLNEIVNSFNALRFFGSDYEILDKSHPFSIQDYFRYCASACCHTWL